MKRCYRCLANKALEDFAKNRAEKDGRCTTCKACQKVISAAAYARNRETLLAKQQARRDLDREGFNAKAKQHRDNNLEEFRKRGREHSKRDRVRHKERWMLGAAKQRAQAEGVPFSISINDIVIPTVCPIFGIEIKIGEGRDLAPSLDRIVPNLGYVPGNVRVISMRANRIKSDSTESELRSILRYVESGGTDISHPSEPLPAVPGYRTDAEIKQTKKERLDVLAAMPKRTNRFEAVKHMFGHATDKEIAAVVGCIVQAVASYRYKKGIPLFSARTRTVVFK